MTNITNKLPDGTLKAKIIVEGLFVFCINEKKQCVEFGVYEFADEHNFSIKISKFTHDEEEPEQVGETIELKPRRGDSQMNHVLIGLKDQKANVSVYQSDMLGERVFMTDPKKLIDINPNKEVYESDFRWVIDLEGPRFHNRRYEITPGTIERKITILNGIVLTNEIGGRIVKRAFPKVAKIPPPVERCYVAFQLAIDLPTDSIIGSPIAISYGESPEAIGTEISLAPSDDYYYEIKLDNNCHRSNEIDRHFSDFQHYYNVLAEVPVGDRYDFERYDGSGSRETPCDLIFLGQHEELE